MKRQLLIARDAIAISITAGLGRSLILVSYEKFSIKPLVAGFIMLFVYSMISIAGLSLSGSRIVDRRFRYLLNISAYIFGFNILKGIYTMWINNSLTSLTPYYFSLMILALMSQLVVYLLLGYGISTLLIRSRSTKRNIQSIK